MSDRLKKKIYYTMRLLFGAVGLCVILPGVFIRAWKPQTTKPENKPRLFWGTTPLKNFTYLSAALREAGYVSETAVVELYPIVNGRDFDTVVVVDPEQAAIKRLYDELLAPCFMFAAAIGRFDIFHFSFDGGLLRRTALAGLEAPLLKLAGKSLVVMAYGSDAFVYDRMPPLWRHALVTDYEKNGRQAAKIESRIRHFTYHADIVIGSLVHFINLPKWDILPLLPYPVDTNALQPVWPRIKGTVRIAHAPNHRGVKGTEFLVNAVERLIEEGHDIELILIEGQPNDSALKMMAAADIFVDQLIFGYALAAIEAMALGKIVVTGIEDSPEYRLFRRVSFLDEAPVMAASPGTIYNVLGDLLRRRQDWPELGSQTRTFAERRHSFAAATEMYEAIYRRIWYGEDVDLINFYHPLLENHSALGGARAR